MGWWDLAAIGQEARMIRSTQAATPPVSCPNDGTILLRDRAGNWRCNFDGWVWDGVRNPLVDLTADSLRPPQSGVPGW